MISFIEREVFLNFVEFLKQQRGITPPLEDKYGDWLGYVIKSFDPHHSKIKTSLNIREEHLSPSGAVHGGVVSGFLDFTCGCAVFGTLQADQLCSTVDLGVKYFKPIRLHDIIEAEAQVVHRGRTLSSVVANLFIKGDTSKVIAMATGTFNIYNIQK